MSGATAVMPMIVMSVVATVLMPGMRFVMHRRAGHDDPRRRTYRWCDDYRRRAYNHRRTNHYAAMRCADADTHVNAGLSCGNSTGQNQRG